MVHEGNAWMTIYLLMILLWLTIQVIKFERRIMSDQRPHSDWNATVSA